MIIVDTNVWSETVRPVPDPIVEKWVMAHSADIALTTITIAELLYGVAVMPVGRRREALSLQIEQLIVGSVERTFSFDAAAARELARIKLARKQLGREVVGPEDGMIAAIAAVRGFSVATRNVDDFSGMGIQIINPWLD